MFKKLLMSVVTTFFATNIFAATVIDVQNAYNRNDISLAVRLAKPLAEKGDAELQFFVGMAMFSGKGVKKDYTGAFHYLNLCADNPAAENETRGSCFRMLSLAYVGGKGVVADMSLAMTYLWKSAYLGNRDAMAELTGFICNNPQAPARNTPDCPKSLLQRVENCPDGPIDGTNCALNVPF